MVYTESEKAVNHDTLNAALQRAARLVQNGAKAVILEACAAGYTTCQCGYQRKVHYLIYVGAEERAFCGSRGDSELAMATDIDEVTCKKCIAHLKGKQIRQQGLV